MKRFNVAGIAILTAALVLPSLTQAESRWSVGSGTLTTTADVDMQIIIPHILYLRVGTAGATVDQVSWDYAATNAINNAVYTGAAEPPALGNLTAPQITNGSLSVYLFSNGGDVDLDATTATVDFEDGSGNTIPMTDIAGSDGGSVTHPTDWSGTDVTIAATGNVVNIPDTWTYTYAPTTTPVAGTYTNTVTYTATSP